MRPKTTKLQTPVRIHKKLRWFLKRWRKQDVAAGVRYFIHFNGKPVDDIQGCWHKTKAKAGFLGEDHGPHILRHSAATWMMQQGINVNLIAGYLGMNLAQGLWPSPPEFPERGCELHRHQAATAPHSLMAPRVLWS